MIANVFIKSHRLLRVRQKVVLAAFDIFLFLPIDVDDDLYFFGRWTIVPDFRHGVFYSRDCDAKCVLRFIYISVFAKCARDASLLAPRHKGRRRENGKNEKRAICIL